MNHIGHKNLVYNRISVFCALLILLFSGCSKDPIREKPVTPPDDTTTKPNVYDRGVFIINEGNYNWGNSSVTFFDSRSNKVIADVFKLENNRSLGDVAESMKISGKRGYIVVNNSNRIEVVNVSDFNSITTITGLSSPRYLELVDSTKAYVTNLQHSISVIDLVENRVTGTIPTSSWTETLIRYKDYMLVTSIGAFSEPSSGRSSKVLVIDTRSDKIIDSIQTGKEPVGIVIDKKEKVWVLCSGGYDSYEPPSLIRINPELRIVEKVFQFADPQKVPSRLCINSGGDTLYFLYGGVYRMAVTNSSLPAEPIVPSNGRLFYGLAIDPSSGNLFVSDAVDYVQNGVVFRYNATGVLLDSFKAGRIPGAFCFTSNAAK